MQDVKQSCMTTSVLLVMLRHAHLHVLVTAWQLAQ